MELKLFHGNVYRYFSDRGEEKIAMYLCDTNLGNMVCLIPIEEENILAGSIKIPCLSKVAYPDKFFEIAKKAIKGPLYIHGKPYKVDYPTYLRISETVLTDLLIKTKETYRRLSDSRFQKIGEENYILTEDYYKYLTWFDFKTKLQFQRPLRKNPDVLQYSVFWAELGRNIGSELEKLRPVIIFKKLVSNDHPNSSSYIVIPITSKQSASKYKINYPVIINGKTNYAKINDIRRISVKRLVKPFVNDKGGPVVISDSDIKAIKKILRDYLS